MLISSFILSGLALATGACSPNAEPVKTEQSTPVPDPKPNPEPTNSRALVVYFTCTNVTKGIAGQIAEFTGATAWCIVPEEPYTTGDLNYNNPSSRANREQNDPEARPSINGKCDNLADYDVIFLGYPIWWGKAPKVIFTFLDNHELSGKTVIPFCTSHSSGIGSSDTDLYEAAPDAVWKQGKRFSGKESKETIMKWIESLDLSLRRHTNGGLGKISSRK